MSFKEKIQNRKQNISSFLAYVFIKYHVLKTKLNKTLKLHYFLQITCIFSVLIYKSSS